MEEDSACPKLTVNSKVGIWTLGSLIVECEPNKCLYVDWLKLGRRKAVLRIGVAIGISKEKSHTITHDWRRQVLWWGIEKLSLWVNQKLTVTHSDGCGDAVATAWTLGGWVPARTLPWNYRCAVLFHLIPIMLCKVIPLSQGKRKQESPGYLWISQSAKSRLITELKFPWNNQRLTLEMRGKGNCVRTNLERKVAPLGRWQADCGSMRMWPSLPAP